MYSANVTEMGYTALATGNHNIFSKVHKRFILCYMCASGYMYMYMYTCTCRCLWRSEEGVTPLGLSVQSVWIVYGGCKKLSPCPLQEQYVRLTAGPTLQPLFIISLCMCVHTCLSMYTNVCTTRPMDTYGSWRTLCESLFFSSIMASGIELDLDSGPKLCCLFHIEKCLWDKVLFLPCQV